MEAIFDRLLMVNLIGTLVIFIIAARLYVLPKLGEWSARSILLPILLLHSFRHLGLMFLTRGAVLPGMPTEFAYPAAAGDLVAAFLALAAIPAVARGSRMAVPLVWVFNVFGTVDLLTAVTEATVHGAAVYMGAAYWIPAFWVPALLVTHYITFVVLVQAGFRRNSSTALSTPARERFG